MGGRTSRLPSAEDKPSRADQEGQQPPLVSIKALDEATSPAKNPPFPGGASDGSSAGAACEHKAGFTYCRACDCYFVAAGLAVNDDASIATADADNYDAEVSEIMRGFAALGGHDALGVTEKNGKSPPGYRAAAAAAAAAAADQTFGAASGQTVPATMCCLSAGDGAVARFIGSDCCCCSCWLARFAGPGTLGAIDNYNNKCYARQPLRVFPDNSSCGGTKSASAAAPPPTANSQRGEHGLISNRQSVYFGGSDATDEGLAPIEGARPADGCALAVDAAYKTHRLPARRTERTIRKRPGFIRHKSESSPSSSGGNKSEKPLTWVLSQKVIASSLIESAATATATATASAAAHEIETTTAASGEDELMRQCHQKRQKQRQQASPGIGQSSPHSNNNNNKSQSQSQNQNNSSGDIRDVDDDEPDNNKSESQLDKSRDSPSADPTEASVKQERSAGDEKRAPLEAHSNKSNGASKLTKETTNSCKKLEEAQQQQQQQQQSDCDKAKAKLAKANDSRQSAATAYSYTDWNLITRRYRKMPRHPNRDKLCWQLQSSCFCRLLIGCFQSLFPIFTSFRDYRLPGDLITDMVAGSTVAVLHIPQGMAYGLLAGVDPIYGLYVSFVPVLVMALMSRSRHVSYGTFAILSMMLANACDLAKLALGQQQSVRSGRGPSDEPQIVLVNNHRLMSSPVEETVLGEQQGAAQNGPEWIVSSMFGASPAPVVAGARASDHNADNDNEPFVMPSNIEILGCICIMVGLIQVTMSLLRLGMLSLMFSDQLVSSFTTASAFHVITSQVPNLFDLSSPIVPSGLFKVCRAWWALTLRLLEGFNYYTAALSLISILFLLLIKELVEPMIRRRLCKSLTCLPSELCLMAFIILSSWYWKFEQTFGIEVIGHVPTNLPAPKPPRVDLIPVVFQDALTIALVSFAMNLSLGQVYAKRNRYQLDPNQELFALGTSNVVGSFFSCFPCASSLSRSAVQSSLNVKSQVCSLFSCTIVVLIICYFAPILHDLPKSTLSCIIVVALKGILFQVKDFYENWRLSKLDAIVWITTFVSVLAFGVTYGLVLGIAASLFMVFVRLLNPNHSILGQLPGTEIYVDRNAFMECREIEQVKIFRFNSALCYLNRTMFKACIEKSLPMIYKRKSLATFCLDPHDTAKSGDEDKIKFLVIDCSALAYCDYSGAETLVDIVEELEESKVQVYLAACPVKLINMIEKMKRTRVLEHNVHPTITDALNHARYLRGRQMQQCSMSSCCGNTENCTCLHSVINGSP